LFPARGGATSLRLLVEPLQAFDLAGLGGPFPVVGQPLTLVRDIVSGIGFAVALVGEMLT
jgi:hypothetical protein